MCNSSKRLMFKKLQLTLEQHWFRKHGSTYMCIFFFNKYSWPSVFIEYTGFTSVIQPTAGQKTVFLIRNWEFEDVEG